MGEFSGVCVVNGVDVYVTIEDGVGGLVLVGANVEVFVAVESAAVWPAQAVINNKNNMADPAPLAHVFRRLVFLPEPTAVR